MRRSAGLRQSWLARVVAGAHGAKFHNNAHARQCSRHASSPPWKCWPWSKSPFIPRISVPALILTARDDPFIAVEPFEELRLPSHVVLRILPHGGHIGFLGWDGAGGIRWAERRLVDWVTRA